jgi:hypothetical protein
MGPPQKVTELPTSAFLSPMTKLPPLTAPKMRTWLVASAVLPPSSTMCTLTVNKPLPANVCALLAVYEPLLPAHRPEEGGELSPQSIVAVKSAEFEVVVFVSVNLATAPLNPWGPVGLTPAADNATSPTVADEEAVAVLVLSSMSLMVADAFIGALVGVGMGPVDRERPARRTGHSPG